jgi:hypothetical protein
VTTRFRSRASRGPRTRRTAVLSCAAGLSLTAALVVGLQSRTADGAFTGTTSDTGNVVGSAPDFCTSPGSVTLSAAADNSVSQSGADALAVGGEARLRVVSKMTLPSSPNNHRTFVRFALPNRPVGCALQSATLKLYLDVGYAGRTLDAYLVDPGLPVWGESGFRFSTQPATVAGTAVGFPVVGGGFASWNVTSSVSAQYAGNHNGFQIRDRNENDTSGATIENVFFSRETPDSGPTLDKQPELVLVWN